MPFRMLYQRGLALALLVALFAGPSGIAGVLHPFDDVEYRQASATDGEHSCQLIGADQEPEAHCPICHLLRSVRWGLSVVPLPGFVPQALAPLALAVNTAATHGQQLTIPGRSPPANDTVQAA